MFRCDIIFKEKVKMMYKIARLPLLALILSLSTPVGAGEEASVSLPDPSFSDCEVSAWAVIPVLEAGTPERLAVSVDCLNTATNEFEVWFCTDEEASWEFRDLVISMDDGCLFVAGRDDESLLPNWSSMPLGLCALDMELRNRLYNQESLFVKSVVNGVQIPVLTMGIGMTKPREWRSVKVVSRGVRNVSDIIVSVSKGEVGFSVILR